MANLYIDGFEWLPTSIGATISDADIGHAGWYVNRVNGQSFNVQTGRFGYGKTIAVNNSQINGFNTRYVKTFPDLNVPAEGFLGTAMKRFSGSDPNGWHGFAFYDAVFNDSQVSVCFGRNGVVALYRGFPPNDFDTILSGALAYSKAGVFDEDAWMHVEAHCLVANSGGSVEVRINTVPVIQLVGADTQQTSRALFDSFALIAGAPAATITTHGYWDDLFVNDTSGSQNNTWLGNERVKTQFMTANGFTDNFTIGGSSPAATNWQSVLNQVLDDTKFVYTTTPGNIDLYVPDPIINAPLVHCVQLRSGLRQDDATQREAKHLLRISGTNYENGTLLFTDQDYAHYFSRWELNPNTGVSFTGADVNGFQVGTKLQV